MDPDPTKARERSKNFETFFTNECKKDLTFSELVKELALFYNLSGEEAVLNKFPALRGANEGEDKFTVKLESTSSYGSDLCILKGGKEISRTSRLNNVTGYPLPRTG